MKNRNYYTSSNYTDHSTFGGLIYESDFNTEYCNGNIASRILSDWRFDEQCRKNMESNDRNTTYEKGNK